jgi:hypothetical protein
MGVFILEHCRHAGAGATKGTVSEGKGLNEVTDVNEGHGFSRVPMSLRLTQGDENHGVRWFSTVP